ncbi:cytochrome P450 [Rhabdothermincola sediminis]|uniref:cytochrome P450 n=1 Tax=Rhabdothermincola sediminis TaxID=2751370 RepID=UPI001AA0585B|nr:cytochrome P450 [Rhabdothermincola sediminis]
MELSDVNLLDPDVFREGRHHEMFKVLRREDPVHFHPEPDGPGFWCITRHADLITVNRDYEAFSSAEQGISIPDITPEGEMVREMMLYMDPPRHTRYRLLVNKGFTPRMIGLLETGLRTKARLIVDNVIERGECDFVTELAAELPLQAIAELMGVPQEDRHKLFEWTNRMIGIDDPEFEGDRESASEAAAEIYLYANTLAAEKRKDPRDDIVSRLLGAEIDGDRLSETEFDMFFMLLAVAGNETTRNATSHGMKALMDNPDQFEKLKANPDLLPSAVEEIVRWATPVLHFRRTAMRDYELGGKLIRKGDKVVMWHISANRDETVFEDPFRFDIERSPNDHIGFGGGGPHYCLGANLARMELRIIFEEIITRMPDIELAGEPEYLRSNFIGGIKHMPVRFTPGPRLEPVPATA